jgi:hypothetical protein
MYNKNKITGYNGKEQMILSIGATLFNFNLIKKKKKKKKIYILFYIYYIKFDLNTPMKAKYFHPYTKKIF